MRTATQLQRVAGGNGVHTGKRQAEIDRRLLEQRPRGRFRRHVHRAGPGRRTANGTIAQPVHVLARPEQPVHRDERVVLVMADQVARRDAVGVNAEATRRGPPAAWLPPSASRTGHRSLRARGRTPRPSASPASSRRCRTAAWAAHRGTECRPDDPAARTCRGRAAGRPAPPSRRTSLPGNVLPLDAERGGRAVHVDAVTNQRVHELRGGQEVGLIGGQDVAARVAQRRIRRARHGPMRIRRPRVAAAALDGVHAHAVAC